MSFTPHQARQVVQSKVGGAGSIETHPLYKRIVSLLAPYEKSIAEAAKQVPGDHHSPAADSARRRRNNNGDQRQQQQQHRQRPADSWRTAGSSRDHHPGGRRRGGRHESRGVVPRSGGCSLPPPTRLTPKTDESFYVGALNRINRSNYRRVQGEVMESLRKTEGEDMWLRVLDITLLQSCVQAFFVDHHVNLVRDMLKACDRDTLHEQLGHRMKERVDAFVTKFLDDTLPNVVTNVAGTVIRDGEGTTDDAASDDDLFCRYVKHKAHLTGANKAVLRLEHEKPQKLLEYARRVGECIPQAVDHASLLMLLEFVLEFVARVKSAPGRGEARACFDKAQTRYADFGRDHPQSRFKLMDVRRALSM